MSLGPAPSRGSLETLSATGKPCWWYAPLVVYASRQPAVSTSTSCLLQQRAPSEPANSQHTEAHASNTMHTNPQCLLLGLLPRGQCEPTSKLALDYDGKDFVRCPKQAITKPLLEGYSYTGVLL